MKSENQLETKPTDLALTPRLRPTSQVRCSAFSAKAIEADAGC